MERSLPRKFRVANPPSFLAGREADLEWIASRLEAGPAVVLVGPPGIGKTALAAAAAQKLGRENTLLVRVQVNDPTENLRSEILWALAQLTSDRVETSAVHPDSSVDEILRVADELNALILIDDAHLAEPSSALIDMMEAVVDYSRSARFILATRSAFPALASISRELRGLREADLFELSRWMAPDATETSRQQSIARSGGSPLLLRNHLMANEGDGSLFGSLSGPQIELLRVLSLAATPITDRLARRLVGLGEEETADLERRGLLIRENESLRLHEFIRSQTTRTFRMDAELRKQIANQLSQTDDPDMLLSAAHVLAEMGAVPELARLLERAADDLLACGEAARLWVLLSRQDDPSLELLRLRCGAELGNATVLNALRQPSDESLDWARALYLMGEVKDSIEALDALSPSRAGVLLRARCLFYLGEVKQARTALEPLTGRGDLESDAFAVRIGVELGESLEDRSRILLGSVSPRDTEALLDLAWTFWQLKRPELALRALDPILAVGGGLPVLVARRARLLRVRVLLDAGDLVAAGTQLEALRPFTRGNSILRPLHLELEIRHKLAVGGIGPGELNRVTQPSVLPSAACKTRLTELEQELRQVLGVAIPNPESARGKLAAGEFSASRELARFAQRHANKNGRPTEVARALMDERDVVMATGMLAPLESIGAALQALAETCGSNRWRLEAEVCGAPISPAVLERIAGQPGQSPPLCRRARFLLSGSGELDEVDRRVVDGLAAALPGRRFETRGTSPNDRWSPAWGLDLESKTVWLPDGRVLEFRSRPKPWHLLCFLFNHNLEASHEEIMTEVWELSEYHPLRHKSRLQTSVSSLRRILEDDPAQPVRLATIEEGYRLGGPVRRFGLF